ncbi:hypothetical protein EYC84_006617 [Monilinia fructicola]|uniref:Uncharacterized protein n=1 Tax=Monilinia fructicola TaxID=38448 RepID=A0A5M9K6N2_MONFR|nr:hypothetical protein EYC84_006617 [Monilinia fructicola]
MQAKRLLFYYCTSLPRVPSSTTPPIHLFTHSSYPSIPSFKFLSLPLQLPLKFPIHFYIYLSSFSSTKTQYASCGACIKASKYRHNLLLTKSSINFGAFTLSLTLNPNLELIISFETSFFYS